MVNIKNNLSSKAIAKFEVCKFRNTNISSIIAISNDERYFSTFDDLEIRIITDAIVICQSFRNYAPLGIARGIRNLD